MGGANKFFIFVVSLIVGCTNSAGGDSLTVGSITCSTSSYTLQRTSTNSSEGLYVRISPIHNSSEYYASLNMGVSQQPIGFVIDSGSSNIVVAGGADICPGCPSSGLGAYSPGENASNAGSQFEIAYGSANFILTEITDEFHLPCLPQAFKGTFGVVSQLPPGQSTMLSILGLAYPGIAQPSNQPLTPFLDMVLTSANGFQNLFSLTLCGEQTGSSFDLGNIDPRANASTLQYTPITNQSYYVVNAIQTQVSGWNYTNGAWVKSPGTTTVLGTFPSYNPQTQSGIPTIVDSGTTEVYWPVGMVNKTQQLMATVAAQANMNISNTFWTASSISQSGATLALSDNEIQQFPMLQLVLQGEGTSNITLDFPPQNYLQQFPGGVRGFSIKSIQSTFILGQAFMEAHAPTVFDRANQRIGFAPNSQVCGS